MNEPLCGCLPEFEKEILIQILNEFLFIKQPQHLSHLKEKMRIDEQARQEGFGEDYPTKFIFDGILKKSAEQIRDTTIMLDKIKTTPICEGGRK